MFTMDGVDRAYVPFTARIIAQVTVRKYDSAKKTTICQKQIVPNVPGNSV